MIPLPLHRPINPRPSDEIATIVDHAAVNRDYRHMTLRGSAALAAGAPGQFYQLACSSPNSASPYLRRPFSLYGARPERLEVEFLYKITGEGTQNLALMSKGDNLRILGPLGQGYCLAAHWRHVVVVGRGVGLATLYPAITAARRRGIGVTAVISARCAEAVPPLPLDAGVDVHIVTDDTGQSAPHHVETLLRDLIRQGRCDAFLTCGSKRLTLLQQRLADEYALEGQVALEQQMSCGLGMCFCCVCDIRTRDGIVSRRVCWDGPVFALAEALP